MLDIVGDVGQRAVDAILGVAHLLVYPWVPGLVSLTMVVILAALVLVYRREVRRVISANHTIRDLVTKSSDEEEFRESYIETNQEILALKIKKGPISLIVNAWDEFTETLIVPKDDTGGIIRNTLRPHVFLNRDDLLVEHTHWRQVPGIFVSVGLFLTFLGLIAALNEAGDLLKGGDAVAGLTRLLTVASSKFIMSLTGLFCSIIFTLAQRNGSENINESFHQLCSDIELRLSYQSAEALAMEQVEKFEDFRQDQKVFSANLVAQLGKSLTEELPARIQQSMSEVIGPIMERVGQSGSDGVGALVDKLSQQMSHGLDGSMDNMSKMLDRVTDTLSSVASRTEDSSGHMSAALEKALTDINSTIGNLNSSLSDSSSQVMDTFQSGTSEIFKTMGESLDQIRANTADSARVLDEAAQKIVEAAANFGALTNNAADEATRNMKEGLQDAAKETSARVQAATESIVQETKDASEALHSALIEPIDALSSSLDQLGSSVTGAADRVNQYANSVGGSVIKIEDSNASLELTVQALNSATEPVRESGQKMERAAGEMKLAATESASAIKLHVEKILNSTVQAIEGIQITSKANSQTIENTANALNSSVERFSDVIERYDTIDENLGEAFDQIENKVKASIEAIKSYATEVHTQNTDALNRLRQVVESIDQFTPPR